MAKRPGLAVEDTSTLTDGDWTAINKVKYAYGVGGVSGASKALKELQSVDPIRAYKVLGAFFPIQLREVTKDQLAEEGITKENLEEIIRAASAPPTNQ
jgi:hypothetical protein